MSDRQRIPAEQVTEGSCWRHRNGRIYEVVGFATFRSSSWQGVDGDRLVLYEWVGGPTDHPHARLLHEFCDGRYQPASEEEADAQRG